MKEDPSHRLSCHLADHLPREAAIPGNQRNVLSRQIDATDRQIDALVYELYDLTDEEIALVEGRAPSE